MKTKLLIINSVTYAKYQMDEDVLYMKVVTVLVPESSQENEDLLLHLIQLVEKRKFLTAAYLNVP